MVIDDHEYNNVHLMGENATHSIVQFSGRLAVLLFVAGISQPPHRALPCNPKTAHSNASSCGF